MLVPIILTVLVAFSYANFNTNYDSEVILDDRRAQRRESTTIIQTKHSVANRSTPPTILHGNRTILV